MFRYLWALILTLTSIVAAAASLDSALSSFERALQSAKRGDTTAASSDFRAAEQEFTVFAQHENPTAQFYLAFMYDTGVEGIPSNSTKAELLYRSAAEQGHVMAQTNLGAMYQNGRQVERDLTKAVEWYLRAALQGEIVAQYNLGVMYQQGLGVPQDEVKAFIWFTLSAADDYEDSARLADQLAENLAPGEMALAGNLLGLMGFPIPENLKQYVGAPAPAIPSEHLGCYRDKKSRDLAAVQWGSFKEMTPDVCVAHCRLQGFAYAGVQYSNSCFCDDKYGAYGEASNCDMRCTGDAGQICGGRWANSVYRVGVPAAESSVRIGCYLDKPQRDMFADSWIFNGMTTSLCTAHCQRRGFKYAGVQNGNQCFCDNNFGSHGSAETCTKPCVGNAAEKCGGVWANAVYRLVSGASP